MQVHGLPPPPADLVNEYLQLGEHVVPSSLMRKAIAPRSVEDTETIASQYLGEDRVGPANVHNNDPDGLLQRAVAGVDAEPPVPDVLPTEPQSAASKLMEAARHE
jgi:hypothetical protein